MRNRVEFELGQFIEILDKQYFDVSEEDRDSIARLIVLRELVLLQQDPASIPSYEKHLCSKIEYYESNENYEAADFFKRIKKQIYLI